MIQILKSVFSNSNFFFRFVHYDDLALCGTLLSSILIFLFVLNTGT